MRTVGSYIGQRSIMPPTVGGRAVGIEVEIEHVTNTTPLHVLEALAMTTPWTYKVDPSLRNSGLEFITAPIDYRTVPGVVTRLCSIASQYKWKPSVRSSIHVHVNVRDFTLPEIRALATVYALVEPVMFDFVGEEREECIYCIPWYRSTEDVEAIAQVNMDAPDAYKEFLGSPSRNPGRNRGTVDYLSKYSALYLEPVTRYGTVEFRHAPTWTDPDTIDKWTRACVKAVEYAKGKSAKQVWDTWNSGAVSFIENALGGTIPIPTNYTERVEALDADYSALILAGVEVDMAGWVRLEDNLPADAASVEAVVDEDGLATW